MKRSSKSSRSVALDADLIPSAQAVVHYGIVRYGTLTSWAAQLDYTDAVAVFDATLLGGLATDQKLTAHGEI